MYKMQSAKKGLRYRVPIQYINAQFIPLGAPYTVPFDPDEIDKKKASISPYWRRTMADQEGDV